MLHLTMSRLGHCVLVPNDRIVIDKMVIIMMLISSNIASVYRLLKHLVTEGRRRLLLGHHLRLFIAHRPCLRFCHSLGIWFVLHARPESRPRVRPCMLLMILRRRL